eukprot:CAMPEP_0197296762 /NCGR_PEP_ID=MMETSP0890-20130614/39237_1 /TAXON_ID=44058 ORGANISM="Aureoumbra lagunensis, Strain CCMP1510" /NCGR_SAMPLE_ID=MMETSP0890 /ASSEMBLY_ACC=CAM_ASM_000533 /LENGTH=302 /DNA_ID=CAMNT_0042773495 /DNA_START=225 /DNA_END=1133 /DNA_ORIENTATION=+
MYCLSFVVLVKACIESVDALCASLRILDEGKTWLAVEKKSGMSMHGPKSILRVLPKESQYRLVHRLDDGTSGILVLAKNRKGARALSEAFSERRARKLYIGLTASVPAKKQCIIRGNMIKARRASWKLDRKCTQGGNCACTEMRFRGLGQREKEENSNFPTSVARRLLIALPYTGRSHQIRVAAKAMGASLLGDKLYGGLQADRLYLHAAALQIQLSHDHDINIICKPSSGSAFSSSRFQSAWSAIDFPSLLSAPTSVICCEHPALRPQISIIKDAIAAKAKEEALFSSTTYDDDHGGLDLR